MLDQLLSRQVQFIVEQRQRCAPASRSAQGVLEPFGGFFASELAFQSRRTASVVEVELLIAVLNNEVVVTTLAVADKWLGTLSFSLPDDRLAEVTLWRI